MTNPQLATLAARHRWTAIEAPSVPQIVTGGLQNECWPHLHSGHGQLGYRNCRNMTGFSVTWCACKKHISSTFYMQACMYASKQQGDSKLTKNKPMQASAWTIVRTKSQAPLKVSTASVNTS